MLHTLAGAVIVAATILAPPAAVAESVKPWACSMQCHSSHEGDIEVVNVVAGNEPGESTVTATLTNTGGRAIDVHAAVSFLDARGRPSDVPTSTTEVVTITPGGTSVLTMDVGKDLSAGRWVLLLEVRSASILLATSVLVAPVPGRFNHASADAMFTGAAALAIITILGAFMSWQATRRSARMPKVDTPILTN